MVDTVMVAIGGMGNLIPKITAKPALSPLFSGKAETDISTDYDFRRDGKIEIKLLRASEFAALGGYRTLKDSRADIMEHQGLLGSAGSYGTSRGVVAHPPRDQCRGYPRLMSVGKETSIT